MHRLLAALLLASLLAGCAGQDAATDPASPEALGGAAAVVQTAEPQPLRFASGDYEGDLSGSETFSATDRCVVDCTGTSLRTIDLTPIIPADAPVELVVDLDGPVYGYLETTDTGIVRQEQTSGSSFSLSLLLSRASSGTVLLHFYRGGLLSVPPETVVPWTAHSVVRAGLLVPYMPASLPLQPGDKLTLTASGSQEAALIAPDGTVTRVTRQACSEVFPSFCEEAPLELTANGTAGQYILLMLGDEASPVLGPDVTMVAKRLQHIQDDLRPLASNGATTWSFTPAGLPLLVGITIRSADAPADPFGGGMRDLTAFTTGWSFAVNGPGNVEVLREDESFCNPFCGGGFQYTTSTDFLQEQVRPGEYQYRVTYAGNGGAAYGFALVIV